jgi:hypothetical protein
MREEMKGASVNTEISGSSCLAAIWVFIFLLAGCTFGNTHPQTGVTASSRSGLAQTFRTIIYFEQPAADSKQLFAAVSAACHCQPVFLSAYSGNSLIYEISLSQGEQFESFESMLMRDAVRLGIKLVEQDRILQPQ